MKTFANITLGQLNDKKTELSKMGIPAEFVPEMVDGKAITEYIEAYFGDCYDEDDIDFVFDNIYVDKDPHKLYVLEAWKDDDGNNFLVVQTIYA